MNAAFLLMTTTWFAAGQAPAAPPPVAAPPAVVAPAAPTVSACGGGCCTGCSDPCGCDSFGQRLREHLRGLFARNECCAPASISVAPTCTTCTTCPKVNPCNQLRCDRCVVREWHWPVLFNRDCCAPAPTCCAPVRTAPVCDACGPTLLERLRARFHRSECNTCSTCGTGTVAPAPVEQIAPPGGTKVPGKMPNVPVPPGPGRTDASNININQGPIPTESTTINATTVVPSTAFPSSEINR